MDGSDYYDLMRIPMRVRRDAEAILLEIERLPDGECATTAQLAAELLGCGDAEDSYLLDLDRAPVNRQLYHSSILPRLKTPYP